MKVELGEFLEICQVFGSAAGFFVFLEVFQINQVNFNTIQYVNNPRLITFVKLNT